MVRVDRSPPTRTVLRGLALLAPVLLLGMLVASILLWDRLRQEESEQQMRELDAAARSMAGRIETRLDERMAALTRMAARWEAAGGTPRHIWEADAAGYVRDMPGVIAVQWLDRAGQVRWVVPLAGNEGLLGSHPNRDPARLDTLAAARTEQRAALSRPVPLIQGGAGVLVFHPVQVRGQFDGFLVSVIRLEPLMAAILRRTPAGGAYALEYDGHAVYRSVPDQTSADIGKRESRAAIAVGDGHWILAAWPQANRPPRLPLSGVVLGAGIAGTLLLAGVLWFWRLALLRAAESSQLAHIVARTTNAVILTDASGRVEWVNDGFTRITGYALGEVRGRKPGDVLQGPDTDPATVARMRTHLARGEGFREEILNYHKNGRPFWLEIEVQPAGFEGGAPTGFMAIEADITERKKVERMKNEFIATVSHELRTPLTSIRGALGLVTGGVAGPVSDQAKQLLETAAKNSERLTELINDILDIEKIESGSMTFALGPEPLARLISQALEANAPYAAALGVSLRLAAPVPAVEVSVDGGRFVQVMNNLLSNAAKFSPRGSVVEISAAVRDEAVRVSVTDQGPGIPDEFRERIFQKFSQADASDTRARGGTGLGLAISKSIVERMGGRIGFESREGRGATFFFDLPLGRGAA